MSKKKQKQEMTLTEVKAILSECGSDNLFLESVEEFKKHPLGKAARAGRLSLEAVGFLYRKLGHNKVREYLLKHFDYTIKDLASVGILGYAYGSRSSSFNELLNQSKKIGFETGLEFVEFVKEKYGIDLSVKPTGAYKFDTETVLEFSLFSSGFTDYRFPAILLGASNESAEANKAFYRDAFLYIVRLLQYNKASSRFGGGDLEEVLSVVLVESASHIGAFNYPILKELVENEIRDKDTKIAVLMAVANAGCFSFNSLRNPFDSFDTFLEVIKDIKELATPAVFPYAAGDSLVHTNFIRNLLGLGVNIGNRGASQATRVRLAPEQKLALFTEVYAPLLKDEDTLTTLATDFGPFPLFEALLNTAPIEQRDKVYCRITQMGYQLVDTIIELCRMEGIEFFPTELMTQELISDEVNWPSMAVPKERLYDLEYIDSIVSSIGDEGILFGGRFRSRNEFFVNNIDPSKLPKEFYDKYDSAIVWRNLSQCINLPISFVKENRKKIDFSRICTKVALSIDDELAEWLLDGGGYAEMGNRHYAEMRDRRYLVRRAGSLSVKFIAKNLSVLAIRKVVPGERVVGVSTPNITLATLLEELAQL